MKKKLVGLLVSMLLIATVSSVAVNANIGEDDSSENPSGSRDVDQWPMFHHDQQNTGYSNSTMPAPPTTVLWKVRLDFCVVSSPAVVDGKLYVGSYDNNVYCLNATSGNEIWSYPTGDYIQSSPAVVDGKVFIGSNDKNVYCLDADPFDDPHDEGIQDPPGVNYDLIWKYNTNALMGYSSPTVEISKVYIGSGPKLFCLDAASGSELWNYTAGSGVKSSPAVADGKVYFGSNDNKVYCLNAENGSEIWNYITGGKVRSSPAVADGKVYVGSNDKKVYCLNAENGSLLWKYTTGGLIGQSSPAVAYDKVYIGSGLKLFCLDATSGNESWNYTMYDEIVSSPAVADGMVFIGINDWAHAQFYCLYAENGSLLCPPIGGSMGQVLSSPAIADGKIYVSTYKYWVYCLGPNNPPETPDVPDGPTEGTVGEDLCYSTNATDPDEQQVYYKWHWGNEETLWVGPYNSSEEVVSCHNWTAPGIYEVKVKAKDTADAQSNWSNIAEVTIINNAPGEPEIDGPEEGIVGEDQTFNIVAEDPDGHDLIYHVDWGDDTLDEFGPYTSGVEFEAAHAWNERDTYEICVTADDTYDESPEATHTIQIGEPILEIGEITGGLLSVSAEIKNVGDAPACNVTWNLTVKGGLLGLIDVSAGDTIAILNAESTEVVVAKPVIGLGKVQITVAASAEGLEEISDTAEGFVLLFFVIVS